MKLNNAATCIKWIYRYQQTPIKITWPINNKMFVCRIKLEPKIDIYWFIVMIESNWMQNTWYKKKGWFSGNRLFAPIRIKYADYAKWK